MSLNPVKRLSHCYCDKLTGGHRPGWFEQLLMLLIPHFDIIKTINEEGWERQENGMALPVLRPTTVVYLRRFYLFRAKWLRLEKWLGDLYLHHIVRSDDDPDPHDHPWGFVGFIISGGYTDESWFWSPSTLRPVDKGWASVSMPGAMEYTLYVGSPGGRHGPAFESVKPLTFIRRGAKHIHRVIVPEGKTAWTLIATSPYSRDWNFVTKDGPIHWRQYLGLEDAGDVGE